MTATIPIRQLSSTGSAATGRTASDTREHHAAGVVREGGVVRAADDKGAPLVVLAFLFSLLIPFIITLGQISLQPHRIVILLTMPYLLARLFSGKAGKLLAADFLILFAGLWCALAYTFSYRYAPGVSIGKTLQFGFSFFFELFGGYLIARVGIRSAQDLQRVTKFMFYFILLAIPLAAIEAVSHKPFLMDLLGRAAAYDVRFGMRRAQVVFGHPILYGTFASTAFGLVWYALKPNASVFGRAFRALFVFIAVFFSFSMGAILSFLIQSGSVTYDRLFKNIPRKWTLLVLAFVALYIFLDLAANSSPFSVLVRYLTFNHQASYVRIVVFEFGMQNIYNRPLFGSGAAGWTRPPGFPSSVDNFWLLTAMQFGVPAFAGLAGGVLLIVRSLSLKSLSDPLDRACRAAVLTSICGIILAGGTVHYWQSMLSFVLFMFGSGVWLLSKPDEQPPDPTLSSDPAGDPAADPAPALKKPTPEKPAEKKFVPYGRSS